MKEQVYYQLSQIRSFGFQTAEAGASAEHGAHEMYNFLSGWSTNICGGYWLGVNWTGTSIGNSWGLGFYNPQFGGGVSYIFKWLIFNKK